jgi:hypothetical protein
MKKILETTEVNMKKITLKLFVLLVSVVFVSSLALAGEKAGYHHKKMGTAMETKQAGQILGKSVVSQDGKPLGVLHDLVIFGKGFVHYGILALEGKNDEYVAIPFNLLGGLDDQDRLLLQMDYEKVQGAPSFSMEEITDWGNSEIGEKVHTYFKNEMMRFHPEIKEKK